MNNITATENFQQTADSEFCSIHKCPELQCSIALVQVTLD